MTTVICTLQRRASLLLGLAGGLGCAAFAGWSMAGLAAGAALIAAGAALAARRADDGDADSVSRHVDELQAFGNDLAPVWAGQIESSRHQMEEAVTSLTVRFAEIAARLDHALGLSTGGAGGESAADVSARSQQQLDSVLQLLRTSMRTKAEMMAKVQGLQGFVNELHGMVEAIAQVTQQTNLLAINATIEAAHAGSLGRGFATVAQEVRALSKQSGETGVRIAEKIDSIGAAIVATCSAAEESTRREQEAVAASEATIHDVLSDFRSLAESLAGAAELLRQESQGIKGDVDQALVQLQFQDRISQVMSHVSANIERMPEVIRDYGEQCRGSGTLEPLSAAVLLAELEKTYAMADERAVHRGAKAAPARADAGGDITFF